MKESAVKNYIGTEHWNVFLEFMQGQTVGINPDGSTEYYDNDVEVFKSRLERIASGEFDKKDLKEVWD